MTMKLCVWIDAGAAVKAGLAECGRKTVEITTEWLSGLSQEERDLFGGAEVPLGEAIPLEMAHRCFGHPDSISWHSRARLAAGTLEEILSVIRAEVAREKAAKVEVEERKSKLLTCPIEELISRWAWHQQVKDREADLQGIQATVNYRPWVVRDCCPTSRREEADAECARRNEILQGEAEVSARESRERSRKAYEEVIQREEAREKEMSSWISEHGSSRLRRMNKEGIECENVYRDERLSLERPGWTWFDFGLSDLKPRNVPEEALDLLDEARASLPEDVRGSARLSYTRGGYRVVSEYQMDLSSKVEKIQFISTTKDRDEDEDPDSSED
ncbi:MAG: hypothetical protein FJ098_04425 [Deltaproteobacteria bacterium]|nr:hypothetical protein [Deltaproteobacteria bacterium]